MSVPHGILYLNQKESDVMVGLLFPSPDFKAVQGGQFCLRVEGKLKPVQLGTNIEVPPQGAMSFVHWSAF